MVSKNRFNVLFEANSGRLSLMRFYQFFFISFIILGVLAFVSSGILAATLTCTVNASGDCGGTFLWYQQNETGGYYNAHAQNVTNDTFPRYNYGVCCTSDNLLMNDCTDSVAIKLFNLTNNHVQVGNYSGATNYDYPMCISADPGFISCKYEINETAASCVSAGYTCLASIASSEVGDNNITNSHVGPCSEYNMKICCSINTPPNVTSVVLNSTRGTNYTTENLTVYFTETDIDGDSYTNITDWRKEGRSIAVLNMPFNTNISSESSKAVRDYSNFSNNGTLGHGGSSPIPLWVVSGKVGGAYSFPSANPRYIRVSDSPSFNITYGITLSAWIKQNSSDAGATLAGIITKANITDSGYNLAFRGLNNLSIVLGNAQGSLISAESIGSGVNLSDGSWHLISATYNNSLLSMYVDGSLADSTAGSDFLFNSNKSLIIGHDDSQQTNPEGFSGARLYRGMIDEIFVLNSSLSAAQINHMYRAGLDNHSVQIIVADETTKGENWSVAVTGNDGHGDGSTVLSNNLLIRNSLPNVTILSPPDQNATTNRTPIFNWSVVDDDGDVFTSQVNLSAVKYVSQPATVCSEDIVQTTTATTFIPSQDLACFYDNGYQYNWTVRANDSAGYGDWTVIRRLNITALTDISMIVDQVDFGSLALLVSNNTTTNSPPPFKIQNNGNSLINVTINATRLWLSIANPNQYYKFKIDNVTTELNAFNWSASVTSFTNMPADDTSAIISLKYPDTNDTAEIDIYVEVPPGESPGARNSTVNFLAVLSE